MFDDVILENPAPYEKLKANRFLLEKMKMSGLFLHYV